MDTGHEMWIFSGGLVAAAFAVVRLSMHFNRTFMDRLMRLMEANARQQNEAIHRLADAVEDLRLHAQEHNIAIRRAEEWAHNFANGGATWELR
jgi:hypothetical protein